MKTHNKIILSILLVILCTGIVQGATIDYKQLYSSNIGTNVNKVMEQIHTQYSDITEIRDIGYSAVGNIPIKAIKLGKGERSILINGTHHARETMTAILTINQLEDLAKAYQNNETRHGYSVRQLLNTISIWFVPMTNPDGANLAMSTKPSWKANGRGVDLNRNYPTLYAKSVSAKYPGSQGYSATPFSEPETQSIYKLCEEMQFESVIAYHSAGEIIYWWYHQTGKLYNDTVKETKLLSNITGYSMLPISQQRGGLGFTDWFIQNYKKPGYTIEIGRTANGRPLVWGEYSRVWQRNKSVPLNLIISTLNRETQSWKTKIGNQMITGEALFGRGMVPVNEVSKALGITLNYDVATHTVYLNKGQQVLSATIGEKVGQLNGQSITLTLPVYAKNSKTYISLKDLNTYFKEIDAEDNKQEGIIEDQGDEVIIERQENEEHIEEPVSSDSNDLIEEVIPEEEQATDTSSLLFY